MQTTLSLRKFKMPFENKHRTNCRAYVKITPEENYKPMLSWGLKGNENVVILREFTRKTGAVRAIRRMALLLNLTFKEIHFLDRRPDGQDM